MPAKKPNGVYIHGYSEQDVSVDALLPEKNYEPVEMSIDLIGPVAAITVTQNRRPVEVLKFNVNDFVYALQNASPELTVEYRKFLDKLPKKKKDNLKQELEETDELYENPRERYHELMKQ